MNLPPGLITACVCLICVMCRCCVNCEVYANNTDRLDHTFDSARRRQPRLLSFETKDSEIEISMEFAVPFVKIPVKKSINDAWGMAHQITEPLVNINVGAIGLAALIGAASFALSSITRMFSRPFSSTSPFPGTWTRDDPESPIARVMNVVDKVFQKYDIDPTSCTQKSICWAVGSAATNVARGKGSSGEKIIDGIFSSKWVSDMIAGTAVDDAVQAGRFGTQCDYRFVGCKYDIHTIKEFVNRL